MDILEYKETYGKADDVAGNKFEKKKVEPFLKMVS